MNKQQIQATADAVKSGTDAASDTARDLAGRAERLMDGARDFAGNVSHVAAESADRVRQTTREVADRAHDAADGVSKAWSDAADSEPIQAITAFVRKNPVVAIAGAVAFGILVGRMAPRD